MSTDIVYSMFKNSQFIVYVGEKNSYKTRCYWKLQIYKYNKFNDNKYLFW